jgi:acyl carrier protein
METNEIIISRLTPIFRDVFNDDMLVVGEGMIPADVPVWDSLSYMTLIAAVEQEFGIKVSHKDAGSLERVTQLVA